MTRSIRGVFFMVLLAFTLMGTRNAAIAQSNLSVGIRVGDTIPGVVRPTETAAGKLTAYLYDPATGVECDISGTTWQWTIYAVHSSADYQSWSLIWPNPIPATWPNWSQPVTSQSGQNFSVSFNSSTSQSPDLYGVFQTEGFWRATVMAAASYPDNSTNPPTSRTATPSQPAPVDFNVQQRRLILLYGYWPPTDIGVQGRNGMLNAYSTRARYKQTNYDVLAITPEFTGKAGTYAGGIDYWSKGANRANADAMTVDYRATSSNFWSQVQKFKPVAIMSFSLGKNDKKWVLEPWATNWANNDEVVGHQKWTLSIPYIDNNNANQTDSWNPPYRGGSQDDPSPNKGTGTVPDYPPDKSKAADARRNTTLPVDAIVQALNAVFPNPPGNLQAVSVNNDGPGPFVSNFMAYHVAWWQTYSNARWPNDTTAQCKVAGHTHVGIQIAPADCTTAVEKQLDALIASW